MALIKNLTKTNRYLKIIGITPDNINPLSFSDFVYFCLFFQH